MGDEIDIGSKPPLFSKTGKRWVIAVSVIGVLVTAATVIYGVKLTKRQPSATPLITHQTPKVEAVTALGRLEPQGEVIKLSSPPNLGGAKVDQLLIEEGDTVKTGQIIAILDNYERKQATVERAQQEVKVAQANLKIVQAGAKSGEIEAQRGTVKRLQAQLQGAIATNQAKIARLEAQLQGEKKEQVATIDRLQAELGNAEREFQRYQQLAQNGAISESDLDQRRLTLETAREKVKEATAKFSKTITTLTEEIREAKADLQEAINTLEKQIQEAQATLDKIAEVRGVDVQKAQAEIDEAIAALTEAKEDLKLSYVKSPINGQVLKIHAYPGEIVDETEGIVELGKTNQMMVIAEVYESDINKVRLGQRATIKSENNTFTGELQGSVSQIGLQVGKKDVLDTDPAADVDVRVIEVKIILDSPSSRRVSDLTYAKVLVKIIL